MWTGKSWNGKKNKKVLLVNTASECGYTAQYAELQTLYERYRENLVVLAFPANDFMGQEPGTEAEIVEFCTSTYDVQFPIFAKISKETSGRLPATRALNWRST